MQSRWRIPSGHLWVCNRGRPKSDPGPRMVHAGPARVRLIPGLGHIVIHDELAVSGWPPHDQSVGSIPHEQTEIAGVVCEWPWDALGGQS